MKKLRLKILNFKAKNVTKEDVVRLCYICIDDKVKEIDKRNNSILYIIVAIVSGVGVVFIEFFPTLVISSWLGKVVGAGTISALTMMILKSLMKGALTKTGFISNLLRKILSPFKKIFRGKKDKK